MLKREFDPLKPYCAVIYTRRSSKKQNDRSPAQQDAEVRRVLKILRYPWKVVKVYRDTKSGRYLYSRDDFQQMLRDIKSGTLNVDLILLDTFERLGRAEEIAAIRKELRQKYGVLVVCADNRFADPTTPQGQVYGAFENLRATEENRVKGHQVLRSKRDLALRGFWPGGPRPLGYKLVPVTAQKCGDVVVEGKRLDPFSEEDWIIKLLFERAHATGHGQTKLARYLGEHSDIPAKFKPFHSPTVGYWLDNEIYYGELVWNENATEVIDDTRRVEPNPDEEVLRVPGFCEPLVSRELWDAVQAVREPRREQMRKRRRSAGDGDKHIAPLAPGLTLTYLLTGLVRCGICGASMRPIGSGSRSKAGKKYVYYQCPRSADGNCINQRTIPEQWLREVVVTCIKERLFAMPE